MNKLTLTARPTKDPGIIYTGEGEKQKVTAKFTAASNRIYKREGEADADFIPCVAFGRQAKFIEEYVKKGVLLLLTGPVRNNDYLNKEGVKVFGFQMIVESVELLEKKNSPPVADADGYMQADEEVPFAQRGKED